MTINSPQYPWSDFGIDSKNQAADTCKAILLEALGH